MLCLSLRTRESDILIVCFLQPVQRLYIDLISGSKTNLKAWGLMDLRSLQTSARFVSLQAKSEIDPGFCGRLDACQCSLWRYR